MEAKEYKGNSHVSREGKVEEEKKEIKPVVRGSVTVKKEPIGRKFSNVFFSDTVQNVKSYIIFDVLVPAVKDTIADMVNNTVNMMFYNQPSGRRGTSSRRGDRVSYNSYSKSTVRRESDNRDRRPVARDRISYSDIIFEARGDAQEVIACMCEIVDKYGIISLAEYYDLAKVPDDCRAYTDNDYGWFDLPGDIPISRDRDGYIIKLPRPECIK